MSTWRMVGLNYVNYSNIAARVLRKSLKANLRDEAGKRDISAIRYFYWLKGEMLAHGKKLEPEKEPT
ncbi:protein stunted-like [Ostrinia furnacalis]|uniref:protein stunted-like n=1 Tax=Ostrinia furnacalis TaxID=93504 RepID=UPI00103B12B8|nr:protein stunted-like [Ostrinia furnacalis]